MRVTCAGVLINFIKIKYNKTYLNQIKQTIRLCWPYFLPEKAPEQTQRKCSPS